MSNIGSPNTTTAAIHQRGTMRASSIIIAADTKPSVIEPASPINILAGCRLKGRNPQTPPTSARQVRAVGNLHRGMLRRRCCFAICDLTSNTGRDMVNLASQIRRPHISDTRRPQKAARQKMTRLWRAFRERADLRQSCDQISSTSPLLRMSASVTFQMTVIIEPFITNPPHIRPAFGHQVNSKT